VGSSSRPDVSVPNFRKISCRVICWQNFSLMLFYYILFYFSFLWRNSPSMA